MAQTYCRWRVENSFCIGPTSWTSLEKDAPPLDPRKYSSITEALAALNNGIVDRQGFCLAFSKKLGSYYLLWPSEMAANEVKNFTIGLTNSLQMRALLEQRETEQSYLNDVRRNGWNSSSASSFVSTSTTDTASRLASPDRAKDRDNALPIFSTRDNVQVCEPKTQTTLQSRGGDATSQELPAIKLRCRSVDETNIVAFDMPCSLASFARDNSDRLFVDETCRRFQDTGATRTLTDETTQLQLHQDQETYECDFEMAEVSEKTQPQSSQHEEPEAEQWFLSPEIPLADNEYDMAEVPLASSTTMSIELFQVNQNEFDPVGLESKTRLLQRLGLPDSESIERLDDNAGSFNDGVWMVSDANSSGLVMKLVPHERVYEARKTDTEKYMELQQRCPKIASELSLTVPVKILQLIGPDGSRCKDLLVMRRAPGLQITQHLFHKYHAIYSGSAAEIFERTSQLLGMFWEFGRFLQILHRVYTDGERSMQHGDCQPSNVFYDEVSGDFTLVDVADFGFGPFLALGGEDDVEHFVWGLCSLKPWYGEDLINNCADEFRKGYSAATH